MSIVRAKLLPPRLPGDTLDRPQIRARLDDIWSHPVGLVVAPAGFGKSTVARLWMEQRAIRVAWLWLDEADNDIDRFVHYLLMTIASVDADAVANTRSLFERSSRPTPDELAETLADELIDCDDDLCVILDEAEHIKSAEIWAFVEHLLRHAPPRLHILVLSRIDPSLPLSQMRMRNDIVELRGPDLLFTPDDIHALFAHHGVSLDAERAADIMRLTSGWPAGVRLALAQETQPHRNGQTGEPAMTGKPAFALDTLAGDLLDQLPAAVADAVLAASIVDDLSPRLLGAMVGETVDPRTVLDDFAGAGVLITASPRGGAWKRMHPLFRELFQRQLVSRRARADIAALHRRAAHWLIDEGDIGQAVPHLLAARATDELVDVLGSEISRAFDREDWPAIAEWLQGLPDDLFYRSPALALARCWLLYFRGNWLAMRSARDQARALLATLPQTDPKTAGWLTELDSLDALARSAIPSEGPDAADVAERLERSAQNVDSSRRFILGHVYMQRALALECMGRGAEADAALDAAIGQHSERVDAAVIRQLVGRCFILRQRGDIAQLETASSELALLADRYALPLSRGWALLFQGLAVFQRNDLAQAESLLSEVARSPYGVHVGCLREAMLLLGRIYTLWGDPTETSAVLRRLREILANESAVEMLPAVASFERYLAVLIDPRATAAELRTPEPMTIINSTPHAIHHPVTSAVLIASEAPGNHARHALEMAETFAERMSRNHFQYWLPEAIALKAIALSGLGRDDEAHAQMRLALQHPIARSLKRTFLDLGQRAHTLYQTLTEDPDVGQYARWLTTTAQDSMRAEPELTQTASLPQATYGGPLLSLLTDRELTVLNLLEQRLSYKEIGATLYISPLTVKRHAGNIYDKLGVDSRRDAVARALELGWRPDHRSF